MENKRNSFSCHSLVLSLSLTHWLTLSSLEDTSGRRSLFHLQEWKEWRTSFPAQVYRVVSSLWYSNIRPRKQFPTFPYKIHKKQNPPLNLLRNPHILQIRLSDTNMENKRNSLSCHSHVLSPSHSLTHSLTHLPSHHLVKPCPENAVFSAYKNKVSGKHHFPLKYIL